MRLILALCLLASPAMSETTLKIMSFNIWGAGANAGQTVDDTVAAIRASGADVVGLQETRAEGADCTAEACPPLGASRAGAVAAALGWQVQDQQGSPDLIWANAVISRFPITGTSPGGLGVSLDVEGREVWVFNIHLDDAPYQPYQLLGIDYGGAPFITTEAEAVRFATETRGAALDLLFADLAAAGGTVVVTGDFNEPSHQDWTPAAAAAGQKPVAVAWPSTLRLTQAGFTDTYRAIHPDPVAKPAFTWTPSYEETASDDHPDRIDYVFVRGDGVQVRGAAIVGEDGPRSDLKVTPWPSDHRASLAEIVLP